MVLLYFLAIGSFATTFTPVFTIQLNSIRHYDTVDVQRIKTELADVPLSNKDINTYEDTQEYFFSGLGRDFHLKLSKNDVLVFPDARLINQAAGIVNFFNFNFL